MARTVFYREKVGPGAWVRAAGDPPFDIIGLTNDIVYELDYGTGIIERTPSLIAASGFTSFDGASGGIPAGWSTKWVSTEITWTEDVGGFLRGAASFPDGRHGLSWDTPGDATNIEVLMKVRSSRQSGTTEFYNGAIVRGSGAAAAETGYRCVLKMSGGTPGLDIGKYVGGTPTTIANFAFAWVTNTWYWIRFRVNGTALQARIWADGGVEGGTWDIDTTDAGISAAGWFGAFTFDGNAAPNYDWDYFSYALDGGTAPSP